MPQLSYFTTLHILASLYIICLTSRVGNRSVLDPTFMDSGPVSFSQYGSTFAPKLTGSEKQDPDLDVVDPTYLGPKWVQKQARPYPIQFYLLFHNFIQFTTIHIKKDSSKLTQIQIKINKFINNTIIKTKNVQIKIIIEATIVVICGTSRMVPGGCRLE